jgi:KaiC/GvpD/RAD55 family RecA-like ATPase
MERGVFMSTREMLMTEVATLPESSVEFFYFLVKTFSEEDTKKILQKLIVEQIKEKNLPAEDERQQLINQFKHRKIKHTGKIHPVEITADGSMKIDTEKSPELYDWAVNG